MSLCSLCPRRCNAPRSAGKTGFCGVPDDPVVARAAPHFGEEPCISGERGSGAVFFSGCNLRCVFCQNAAISRGLAGKTVTVPRLRDIFLELRDAGVHNLNLVTPSHYARVIAEALSGLDLGIPVVWNSSAYDSTETLRELEGLIQIYLPDLKYTDAALAARYSRAPDYPAVATAAIREMFRQTGPFRMDADGMLRSGVLIRHLILPEQEANSRGVIDWAAENFRPGDVLFSLMSQYTPVGELADFPELQHPIPQALHDRMHRYLMESSIEDGFFQELSAASCDMIPAFDGTGV